MCFVHIFKRLVAYVCLVQFFRDKSLCFSKMFKRTSLCFFVIFVFFHSHLFSFMHICFSFINICFHSFKFVFIHYLAYLILPSSHVIIYNLFHLQIQCPEMFFTEGLLEHSYQTNQPNFCTTQHSVNATHT